MGRMYSIGYGPQGFATAVDLFEIVAPSDKVLVLHKVTVGQTSDAGEAEAAMLSAGLYRVTGTVVAGTGGATITPRPLDPGDAAASFTVKGGNATTLATGTIIPLEAEPWNVQAGWPWRPTPEERITIGAGQTFVVRIPVAPSSSIDLIASAMVEEIG